MFWHRTRLTSAGPWPGAAYPLGATYNGAGTNFALFSEVADEVELCLFDDGGDNPAKLLIDPYAKAVAAPGSVRDAMG